VGRHPLVEDTGVVYDDLSSGLPWGSQPHAAAAVVWQEATPVEKPNPLEQQVREAFADLREPVFRYLFSTLGNRADAEDITQETFTRLFYRVSEGDRIENFRAWVFRVAHNLAVDDRKSARHAVTDPLLADAGAWRSPEAGAEADMLERERIEQRRTWIENALRRLSPKERQCLELRAEGLRYREIAEVLGIQVPTVQTFLTRAIAKMAAPEGRP
jgi:RNA polymerase sigma-70 factor, ECF subfamily